MAALAVVVLTLDYGRLPWVALVLALSFGSYGLCKKQANAPAIESLTLETMVIGPIALAYVGWLSWHGESGFGSHGVGHAAAADDDRHRHRGPPGLLRRRGDPGAAW